MRFVLLSLLLSTLSGCVHYQASGVSPDSSQYATIWSSGKVKFAYVNREKVVGEPIIDIPAGKTELYLTCGGYDDIRYQVTFDAEK